MIILPEIESYWYVATPYSKHPEGQGVAYVQACQAAAYLIRHKVPIFCPIAHSHGIAVYGNLSLLDHNIWLPADKPMMDQAGGLLIVKIPTWDISFGIAEEKKEFEWANKPIEYLEWEEVTK
jgi:hypothetical protein